MNGPHTHRVLVRATIALAGAALMVFTMIASPTPPAVAQVPDEPLVDRLTSEHPRLLATDADFAALRTRVRNDPASAQWYEQLRERAERILSEPPSEYEIPDGKRLLATSRRVLGRVSTLSLLYQLDGDERYAERTWEELQAAAEFPDWNPSHFLDTAEMTHAFAIGYDWLYHYWSAERREVLRDAIVTLGLNPGLQAYRGDNSGGVAVWWVDRTSNWNIVCNAGLGMGALAIGDEVPELAEEILQSGLESLPIAIDQYAPDGGYPEGVGEYWGYATRYLVPYMSSLRTAIGDDLGLSDSPGLSTTGDFPVYLTGPTGQTFNYYDGRSGAPRPPEMFWLANRYDRPVYSWWGVEGANSALDPRHLLWYDPDNVSGPRAAALPMDKYFRHSEIATFRSAWEDPNAVFAGFKAGDNQTSHADLDLGDFVLDALGTRWAVELGSENYNVPGYSDRGADGQRWTYYRKRAEGQNTLVVESEDTANQDPLATGEIIRQESAPTEAFAIADLTEAYANSGVSSWQRGVSLLDHRRQVLVQDELRAAQPVDAWWFMHTRADIEISDNGRSAILRNGTERLRARIVSPSIDDVTFVEMDAAPLWSSPNPAEQTPNRGVRKLAVQLEDVEDLNLSVLLTPLREGEDIEDDVPDIEPLAEWAVPHSEVPQLSELTIDGEPLDAFAPNSYTYDVTVPDTDAAPPAATATTEKSGARVIVHQADSVPGTARIEVIAAGTPRVRYEVHFAAPEPEGRVVASAHDGNVPENTIDGDFDTRWSAEGDGQWIRYDLGAPTTVESVSVAWYQAIVRPVTFDIEVSDDAQTWTQVFNGTSSGETLDLENYPIDATTARYLRIVGHGNTANDWTNITELRIHHADDTWPVIEPEPAHLERVELSAEPATLNIGETAQLRLTGIMSDGTETELDEASIEYRSADDVAELGADGIVEGIREGDAHLSGIVTTADRRILHDSITLPVDDPSTVIVAPAADTFVRDGGYADINYGGSAELFVKKARNADSGFNREAYLAFDLPEIDADVVSATLHFSAAVRDSGGTEFDIDFHALEDQWDENALTWSNRPAAGAHLGSVHVDDAFEWRSVDLTPHVLEQLASNDAVNLVVRQDIPDGDNGLATRIRSRENTGYEPYLLIRVE